MCGVYTRNNCFVSRNKGSIFCSCDQTASRMDRKMDLKDPGYFLCFLGALIHRAAYLCLYLSFVNTPQLFFELRSINLLTGTQASDVFFLNLPSPPALHDLMESIFRSPDEFPSG